MPSFSLETGHQLGRTESLVRLRALIDRVNHQFGDQATNVQQTWNDATLDFSFVSLGFKISGTLIAEEDKVRLRGQLPLAAMLFKRKVESVIREELEKILR